MTGYPALELLVNNYLDQSWDLHYLSAWDAVLDFSVREEVSLQITGEVSTLLLQYPTEHELEIFIVVQLDSGFHPYEDGLSVRDWLTAIAAQTPLTP